MRKREGRKEKAYVRRFTVPIYGVNVWVIVAGDVGRVRNSAFFAKLFERWEDADKYYAYCSNRGNRFALFFSEETLWSTVVAHEVFHLTHRIMEYTGEPFDSSKHEQGAALHEWLWERISAILNGRVRKQRKP